MSVTVLNVNDHAEHLATVTQMLRGAGYTVIEARSGADALELASSHIPPVALLVLDLVLPDMSGLEVCRRLKADPETRDIKILHTSAPSITATQKIEGLEAGADGYLTQPFEPRDLLATVRSLIRLSQTEADLGARNELLRVANRRKDEFLAMLAHELRNPLAAIHLGLPMLARFPPRDALEERTLAAMGRQTQLLIQLVDDLLDTARVTQGRIELHVGRVELATLVTTVCDAMRERVFTPRKQQLVVSVPASVAVNGDAARLEQILTNLLDNASKYSDLRTEVRVSLAIRDGQVELAIRDHGIGIDPVVLPEIFELFTQASASIDRSRGGLGIGLTLVKALVELHGGSITASSAGIGHGSEIRLRLPCAGECAETIGPEPVATVESAAFKIVLIDDNEDGRFMLRSLCELQGHEVLEAADGLEGVARTVEARPDIAFVDIGLPGIDGYEVARRLRADAHGGRLPYLVALSGYGSSEHRALAFAAGFDEHIAKPMALDQLAAVMAHARERAMRPT